MVIPLIRVLEGGADVAPWGLAFDARTLLKNTVIHSFNGCDRQTKEILFYLVKWLSFFLRDLFEMSRG